MLQTTGRSPTKRSPGCPPVDRATWIRLPELLSGGIEPRHVEHGRFDMSTAPVCSSRNSELLGQRCLAVPDLVERGAVSQGIGKILPGHLGLRALLGDIRGALRLHERQACAQHERVWPAGASWPRARARSMASHLPCRRSPVRSPSPSLRTPGLRATARSSVPPHTDQTPEHRSPVERLVVREGMTSQDSSGSRPRNRQPPMGGSSARHTIYSLQKGRSAHRPRDVFAFEVNMDNRPTSDAIPAMPPSSPSSSTPPPPPLT